MRDGAFVVSCEIRNTGARSGSEVAQLYVGFEGSKIDCPRHLLRDFAKVELEGGHSRTVTFEVAAGALAYFDEEAGAWRVEEVEPTFTVAPSWAAERSSGG